MPKQYSHNSLRNIYQQTQNNDACIQQLAERSTLAVRSASRHWGLVSRMPSAARTVTYWSAPCKASHQWTEQHKGHPVLASCDLHDRGTPCGIQNMVGEIVANAKIIWERKQWQISLT